MPLTRKMLKALGLEEDKIEQIIDAHTETVDGLKEKARLAEEGAASLPEITKERDTLLKEIETLKSKAPDAAKVQADFDAYKSQVDGEKANAQKVALLQKALADAGVARESAQKALLKVADVSSATVADGKLENAETIIATLKTEYPDFFSVTDTTGTPPVNPPSTGGAGMTSEAFKKLNLLAQMEYLKDHPSESKALLGK